MWKLSTSTWDDEINIQAMITKTDENKKYASRVQVG